MRKKTIISSNPFLQTPTSSFWAFSDSLLFILMETFEPWMLTFSA